jgi:hypothetical protein
MRRRITILMLCLTFCGCVTSKMEPITEGVDVTVVRIPPFVNPNYSRFQNWMLFQRFLFPSPKDDRPIEEYARDEALPNDDSLIYLTLSPEGGILINNVPSEDAAAATRVLSEVFENRTKMGVFEPQSNRIVKAVGVRVPLSASYSDLLDMTQIAKSGGADPIILLLDGHLPLELVSIP